MRTVRNPQVRIDAADGKLDGYADVAMIRRDSTISAGATTGTMPTSAELEAAKHAARLRFRALPGTGYYLPAFLTLDLACFTALALFFGVTIYAHGWSLAEPMFWHSLYYLKMSYALLAIPFLVFLAPVFGDALHGAKATGYDKSGLCVPQLVNSEIKRKDELELAAILRGVRAQ